MKKGFENWFAVFGEPAEIRRGKSERFGMAAFDTGISALHAGTREESATHDKYGWVFFRVT